MRVTYSRSYSHFHRFNNNNNKLHNAPKMIILDLKPNFKKMKQQFDRCKVGFPCQPPNSLIFKLYTLVLTPKNLNSNQSFNCFTT